MSINVRLLRKVKKHILAEPKRLNMGIWILNEEKQKPITGITFPKCGTVGCLAGWAVQLGDSDRSKLPENGISNRATELIGNIKSEDVMYDHAAHSLWMDIHELFFTERWPVKFRDRYNNTVTVDPNPEHWDQARAQVLADVIEDFISKHPYKKVKKIKVKGA